jgi:hypothetical protein
METTMATTILFPLGQTVATPGAIEALLRTKTLPTHLLARHQTGDWGDVDAEDKAANDLDLIHGGQLLSAYRLEDSTKVWVITEADRSATTFLLPSGAP